MTINPDSRNPSSDRVPFNPENLKLESIKYILLDHWLAENIVETPSGRLPLKTAYLFYSHYCSLKCFTRVPIQAFNRALAEVVFSRCPSVRGRRTAQGTLYENITLRGWARDVAPLPREGAPLMEVTLCTA